MSAVEAKPLPGEPCLTVEAPGVERTLVLADVHFGFEAGLARSGAFVPSGTAALEARLLDLVERTGARRLAVLGDVKHAVGHTSRQERFELPPLFQRLAARVPVLLALGNHDAGLRQALAGVRGVTLAGASGVALRRAGSARGGVGLLHGHAWPSRDLLACDLLLCGHSHPAVALVDRLQGVTVEPAWLHAAVDRDVARARDPAARAAKGVVVPAFNPLLGGTPVNAWGLLGPMAKLLRWSEADVFLLDGTNLGRVRDLDLPADVRRALRARRRQVYLEVEGKPPPPAAARARPTTRARRDA